MREPEAGPWPASARFDPDGLEIGGVAAHELAARFGTPLLVVDENEIRDRCRRVLTRFSRVAYAVKAFTAGSMIRIALDEGLHLLCASGGELQACLRAGAPPSRLLLHGNAKTDAELELAARAGIGMVIADGAPELPRLDRAARDAGRVMSVLLRIVPEVEVRTHEAIATGHGGSKFGTRPAEAGSVVRDLLELSGLHFAGLHAHAGSQVLDPATYGVVLGALVDVGADLRRELGVEVDLLDVGGGWGVTYTDEAAVGPDEVAAAVAGTPERCRAEGLPVPEIMVEPGRWLVANAGCTLYGVAAVKEVRNGRTLLVVDGGMSDNLRPMLYGARYSVSPAGRPREEARRVDVVGRHCESGDVLAEDVELAADVGDLVAFAATGAYTYSLASAYNRFGRPAVVGVGDGRVGAWLRREDAADLDRLEVGVRRADPDRLGPPKGVTVRPAHPGDARAFLRFWTDIVAEGVFVRSEEVRHSLPEYRRRFREPRTSWGLHAMAFQGSELAGYVGVLRERHPVTSHVASLGIAVAAAHRGRGIGVALMSEAFAWADEVGVQKIVLSVYPHNTGAIALYRRFGFAEEGRLARHSRKSYGYEDEILMAAWIGTRET